jgi:hypothetical protein
MEQYVKVGILSDKKLNFIFNGIYSFKEKYIEGEQNISLDSGKILWDKNLYDELIFEPVNDFSSFTIKDVAIGINFHWEQKEDQQFKRILSLL